MAISYVDCTRITEHLYNISGILAYSSNASDLIVTNLVSDSLTLQIEDEVRNEDNMWGHGVASVGIYGNLPVNIRIRYHNLKTNTDAITIAVIFDSVTG